MYYGVMDNFFLIRVKKISTISFCLVFAGLVLVDI
jgi:hypothetical protein